MRRALSLAIAGWFIGFVVVCLVQTRTWSFLGDAALIRFAVLAQMRGLAAYRDVHDINLPGSYLLDWLTLHLFGAGAWGLRCYDGALLATSAVAMALFTRRRSLAAGVCGACFLAILHARDGMEEMGQRDLALAVLLLIAAVLVVELSRRPHVLLPFVLGLAIGLATTIKPISLLFFFLLLPCLRLLAARERWVLVLRVAVGWLLPLGAAWMFLLKSGSTAAFVQMMTVDLPLHAHWGAQPVALLVRNLFPPALAVLSVFALVGVWLGRTEIEEQVAGMGMILGGLCYFAQMRGYNYQRYPFIACVLLALAITVPRMLSGHRFVKLCGIGVLAYCVVLCPLNVRATRRLSTSATGTLVPALEEDLRHEAEAETYQCIDTTDGCLNALVDRKRMQVTGTMYDEFLFNDALPDPLLRRRADFLGELEAAPPTRIIVMSGLFPETRGGYEKLGHWPAFHEWLLRCYTPATDRSFSTSHEGTVGYTVFSLDLASCSGAMGAVQSRPQ